MTKTIVLAALLSLCACSGAAFSTEGYDLGVDSGPAVQVAPASTIAPPPVQADDSTPVDSGVALAPSAAPTVTAVPVIDPSPALDAGDGIVVVDAALDVVEIAPVEASAPPPNLCAEVTCTTFCTQGTAGCNPVDGKCGCCLGGICL